MTVSVRLYTCNNKLIATGVKVSVKFYSDKQKREGHDFVLKMRLTLFRIKNILGVSKVGSIKCCYL